MSTPRQRDPARVDDAGIRPPRPYAMARHEAGNGVVVVMLEGEFDLAAAPALRAELEAARGDAAAAVVLDLAAVTFVDSSALRELLDGHERLVADGSRLVLAAVPAALARLMELARVTGVFMVARTVEQALERVAGEAWPAPPRTSPPDPSGSSPSSRTR